MRPQWKISCEQIGRSRKADQHPSNDGISILTAEGGFRDDFKMMSLLNLSSNFAGGMPMPTNLSRAAVINQMNQTMPQTMDTNNCQDDDQQQTNKKGKKEKTKRVRNEMNHKAKLRKFLRNTGQQYVSNAGKVVEAKQFEDKDCGCSKRCMTKVSTEEREKCFEKFWKMGEFSKQNCYLNGLVTREAVKRHRPRANVVNRGPKGVTYQYRINVGRVSKQVCRVYFLDTFRVSWGRLCRALRKEENERDPGEDLRGRRPPVNKTAPELMQSIRDHINSFPRYDVHYQQNAKGKFLKSDLNVKRMYAMYVQECEYRNTTYVKENMYRRTFNGEFSLSFLCPRNDPCPTPRLKQPRNPNRTPRKRKDKEPVPIHPTSSQSLDHAVPMRSVQGCNLPPQMFCQDNRSQNSSSTIPMGPPQQEKDQSKGPPHTPPIYNFSQCQALLQGPAFYPQEQGPTFHNQTPNFFNL